MNQKGVGVIAFVLIIAALAVGYWLGARYGSNTVFNLPTNLGGNTEQNREISNFNKIVLNGCGKVNIEQGEEETLTVKTKEKIMQYVKTEVRNNTLYLEYEHGWANQICGFFGGINVEYDLKVIDLEKIEISSSGKIVSSDIVTESMEMVIDGSGNIEVSLEATSLVASILGSGNIILSGSVESQEVNIDGSGNYSALELVSQSADVSIEGSGKIEVNVAEELEANISGSGSIYYIGTPTVDQEVSGSGKIRALK